MARMEFDLEHVLPTWTILEDGRRAIVMEEHGSGTRLLLILPGREAWEAVHLLHVATGRMYPEIRAAERNEVHQASGFVIVAPTGQWMSGPG